MQIINLTKPVYADSNQSLHLKGNNCIPGIAKQTSADQSYSDTDSRKHDSYQETRELLLKSNPGKLLYSIKETASVLGVSYEYVRQKIQSGNVTTKQFSTRKMISINELTKLIIQGIPS